MPMVYASSDLLLHMAVDESFGNIYIEALAAGLPVVAHDTELTRWIFGQKRPEFVGGNPAFDPTGDGAAQWGPDAWLVDTTRRGQVIRALQSALLSRHSLQSHLNMRASKYSWKTVSEQYAAFMRKVVQSG